MPVNCRTSGFSSSKQTLLVFFSHLSNMHCSIGLQIHYNSTIQLMQLIGKHMGTDIHALSSGLSGGNRNKICFWPHTSAQTHWAPSCSISCSPLRRDGEEQSCKARSISARCQHITSPREGQQAGAGPAGSITGPA